MTNIEEIIAKFGTPLYVYEEDKIKENYSRIKDSFPQGTQIHYAVMANNNLEILRILRNLGSSVQINSLHELDLVKKAGFTKDRISFTSTGLDRESLERLIEEEVEINLDSVEEVEKYCQLNPRGKFGIRVRIKEDIELPEGHTNSPKDSDIGILVEDFDKVKEIIGKYECKVSGIHGYLASNVSVQRPFIEVFDFIVDCARKFPDLEYVNLGSGFAIGLDLEDIGKYYGEIVRKSNGIKLKIEPGRSILGSAGTLFARVTNVKQLDGKKQIAVNAGFAEFARPRIYGAYHDIEVVGKTGETELYDVRGNTVLQSDFLGRERQIPKVEEGDILAIKNTGAYGMVMASGFPGKESPKEVLITSDKQARLI